MLIVEDHELLATSLAIALGDQGLDVETVAGPDPEAIVEAIRALAPVLVLLDLDLGPILGSGLDLIQPAIKAGGRVVIITGVGDRARLGACIEAGAAGVMDKAAGFTELVGAIHRAVGGESLMTDEEREDLLQELAAQRQAQWERSAPFVGLTKQEQAVLAGLVAGESVHAIAIDWAVPPAMVRSQLQSVLVKLGVKSQLAAVALARRANWP